MGKRQVDLLTHLAIQSCKLEKSTYVSRIYHQNKMLKKIILSKWNWAFMASFLTMSAVTAQESYIVVERYSGKVLLADGSEKKRPVASLTKMATAKVVLDWAQATRADMSAMLVIPPSVASIGGANPLQLAVGDQISLRDALYSALLGSDNVAALALAHHVGTDMQSRRQIGGDPVSVFVSEMNQLAGHLGMTQTRFSSPHGLDGDSATASDIIRLSSFVVVDPSFTFYTKQKQRKLTVVKANGARLQAVVQNTNTLLGTKGMRVIGLKTGTTQQAGQCIALAIGRNAYKEDLPGGGIRATPVEMLVVLLGSQQRDGRARQLVAQGWGVYEQWRAAGYPSSPDGREFIRLPKVQ